MNKIEIQGSGFPATNQTWRFLRDMINQVHNLAALGGDNYILSGCTDDGAGNISNGFIVYNGELLPFTGGALGTEVTIVENVEQTTYLEDLNNDGQGDLKDTYFTRTAQFGNTGVLTFNWSDLKSITSLKQQSTPVGGIIMWSGAINAIPQGWKLCDGNGGTSINGVSIPDISGKFIVGYDAANVDYDAIGNTGGEDTHVLTAAEMPVHNHTGTVSMPPHKHQLPNTVYTKVGASGDNNTFSNANNTGSVDVTETLDSAAFNATLNTNNKGGGSAHENRPAFFTLAYIIFVGV